MYHMITVKEAWDTVKEAWDAVYHWYTASHASLTSQSLNTDLTESQKSLNRDWNQYNGIFLWSWITWLNCCVGDVGGLYVQGSSSVFENPEGHRGQWGTRTLLQDNSSRTDSRQKKETCDKNRKIGDKNLNDSKSVTSKTSFSWHRHYQTWSIDVFLCIYID
jgi:hypothetical protein